MRIPQSIRSSYDALSKTQRKAFLRDFKKSRKDTGMAYVAWLFLGWHYLYMGRVGMQFAFWFTAGFLVIGWFIDFFRIPGMVSNHNDSVARSLMIEHKALSAD